MEYHKVGDVNDRVDSSAVETVPTKNGWNEWYLKNWCTGKNMSVGDTLKKYIYITKFM